jgi:hypothetical protein
MHLTYPMEATCIVQDTLGRSGLTGIDMRHDADISQVLQRCTSGHQSLFRLSNCIPSIQPFSRELLDHTLFEKKRARVTRSRSALPPAAGTYHWQPPRLLPRRSMRETTD